MLPYISWSRAQGEDVQRRGAPRYRPTDLRVLTCQLCTAAQLQDMAVVWCGVTGPRYQKSRTAHFEMNSDETKTVGKKMFIFRMKHTVQHMSD